MVTFTKKRSVVLLSLLLLGVLVFSTANGAEPEPTAIAADGEHVAADTGHDGGGHGVDVTTFLWIALILLAAKFSGLIEKWGQPAVLGELVIGVILGNLALVGINYFTPIGFDPIIAFLAELGVVILLFQIGLESNIADMKKVGFRAGLVATIGVIVPFAIGTWLVGPLFFPKLAFNTHLFIGATLTATSVGITARVFKDLGKLKIPEAQIVLGAAVIDDVMGLIILAVVSAMITAGTVSLAGIGLITLKAVGFLVAAVIIGQLLAPRLGKLFSKIHTGHGMKFTLAISFGLIVAFLAYLIGLAPIVGAFAAGLVLDAVHFKFFMNPHVVEDVKKFIKKRDPKDYKELDQLMDHHAEKHIEDLLEPLSMFLVPIFFVLTGFQVDLTTLFDMNVLLVALVVTAVAVFGKVVAGMAAGKVNRWLVGWGMVPRGEVGLIFATIGKGLGVVDDQVFSIIVIVVILTTLMTPPILNHLLKKVDKKPAKA